MEKIVIIGAGLVGASLAFQLARLGRSVTVIEAGLPAGEASGRSFGWINASFALNDAHFALRLAGMAAHQRLAQVLPGHHRASGCLWWEETGEAFAATAKKLADAGYPLEILDGNGVLAREPCLRHPPQAALFFPSEGWVDAVALTRALLVASGAQVLTGVTARIATTGGRVIGVQTPLGPIAADQVVVAAGLGTSALLAPLGMGLPMLHRPGLLLRTAPVSLRLNHILAAPDQEIRQEDDGRLLAPAAASHQSDDGTAMGDPITAAEATLARIALMLGLSNLRAESLTHANRPVPGDGLPVAGRAPGIEGLWIAVMHSGVTLAAVVAEALGAEIIGQDTAVTLQSFRPERLLHCG